MQAQASLREALGSTFIGQMGIPGGFQQLEAHVALGAGHSSRTEHLGSRVCTGNCQEAPATKTVLVRGVTTTKNARDEQVSLI